jgi:DNA polymerase-1
VHDELVLECPRDEMKQTVRLAGDQMENAYRMSIPLTTDARCGTNWEEMKAIKV